MDEEDVEELLGEDTAAREIEETQLEQTVLAHALVEDDAYDRIIVNTPDILRDVVKGALVQKYIDELDADAEENVCESVGGRGSTTAGARFSSAYSPSDAGRLRLVLLAQSQAVANDDDDDDGAFRERSFSEPLQVDNPEYPTVPSASDINVPGGFRREFLKGQYAQYDAHLNTGGPDTSAEQRQQEHHERNNMMSPGSPMPALGPMNTRERRPPSFLDQLLGDFSPAVYAMIEKQMGDDDDDESDAGSDFDSEFDSRSQFIIDFGLDGGGVPTLRRSTDATKTGRKKTFLTLFKCFVATGVMFLPSGFRDAGLFAGACTIALVGSLSVYGIRLLIKTKDFLQEGKHLSCRTRRGNDVAPATEALEDTTRTPLLQPISENAGLASESVSSLGGISRRMTGRSSSSERSVTVQVRPDSVVSSPPSAPTPAPAPLKVNSYSIVALHSAGPLGKWLVQTSILFSQIGFCCVYVSFIGNSLFQVIGGSWPLWAYMVVVIPFVTPLTFIRHLKYFAIPNLLANVFVIFSIVYLIAVAVQKIASDSSPSSQDARNWSCDMSDRDNTACLWLAQTTYPMFFGSAVYVFEGITMVIPVQNSMRHPEQLPGMVTIVVGGVAALFIVFAGVNFYAYAQFTKPIIVNNLGTSGQAVVTALFVPVALFMFPLMVFPASRIIEYRLFKKLSRSGYKWQKNFIRTCIVLFCVAVSIGAGEKVDKLVAIIGGLFCVPIAMVYPPLFFLKSGCAQDFWTEKLPATALLVFGLCAAAISTFTAISHFSK
jgi:amino acid permease